MSRDDEVEELPEPPWDDRDDLDDREASGVYDQDTEPDESLSY